MSKLKHPHAKKTASLEHDRRATSGESPKVPRKAVSQRKALSHRATRRASTLATHAVEREAAPELEDAAEVKLAGAAVKARKAFKKTPDTPLGQHVTRKLTRRRTSGR